jgi:hypothetical protein
MRVGTVCMSPVSGFVQLVDPSHCIVAPPPDVNDIVWFAPSSPDAGNAPDDAPQ